MGEGGAVSHDSPQASRDPIRALLRASHLMRADDLATAVNEHAGWLGAAEAAIYLVDYEQRTLLPLQGERVPPRQELTVDGSLAGLAFRRADVLSADAPDRGHRIWLPLLDGVERLGVLEVVSAQDGSMLEEEARLLASLVAELVKIKDAHSDTFARLRRRKTLSLAAEIQWELLPPLAFGNDRVVITGALEPAYDIGGDTFDYAVNGEAAHLLVLDAIGLVLDAIGHGLPAALLASAAVGAYRHARRNMLDVPEIAQVMDAVIAEQFGPERFATAIIATVDLASGHLRWVNAGHPTPLILREGTLIATPDCLPDPPLGLQVDKPACCETRLQGGDRLLLYTDGIVEARSPDGEFFGEQRLADFILRAASSGDPAPETMRRLMRAVLDHQADQLQDDASIVMLEWRTGDEQAMQL
jgi:serine phosphatase RsbU (regulator of sigma subunit)